jgi:hypothetical protein
MWNMSYLNIQIWIKPRAPFQRSNPEPKCPSKVGKDGLTPHPNAKIGEVMFREKQGKSNIRWGGMSATLKQTALSLDFLKYSSNVEIQWPSAMVGDDNNRPEVSLLLAVAAGSCLT